MDRKPPHRCPPADSTGQLNARDDIADLHRRTRVRGANRLMYLLVRCTFTPFFLTYFRMKRIGRQHVPKRGPVIVASNHRSFLDPFVLATLAWRPMYYVTKQELFAWPVLAWVLSALGAFPVQRGAGDAETIETAKAILARGDIVLIFPEGTRTRPGPLGRPKRGVGRLALETGAPVVSTAVIGSEAVRRGWRIRPHKVRIRAGRPLIFPRVPDASPAMAGAVTEQIWLRIELQWEWLGGSGPIRRVAVIDSSPPARRLEAALTRAGVQVDVGDERELDEHDLLCLALPACALAGVLPANQPRIPSHARVLILSTGLVPPAGQLPSEFVATHTRPRAIAVLTGLDDTGAAGSVTLASTDRGFGRQVSAALRAGRLAPAFTTDVAGVQFAACARQAARLAASVARIAAPALARAAADQVFAEVKQLGLSRGGRPESFVALSDDDVAASGPRPKPHSRNGAPPTPPELEPPTHAQRELIALLAAAAQDAGVEAPVLAGLAALAQGTVTPQRWTAVVTAAERPVRSTSTRVA